MEKVKESCTSAAAPVSPGASVDPTGWSSESKQSESQDPKNLKETHAPKTLYMDDLTYFMAWQNWYLMQYNHFLSANNFLRAVHLSSIRFQHQGAGVSRPLNNDRNTSEGQNASQQGGMSWNSGTQRPTQNQPNAVNNRGQRVIEASLAPLHRRIAAELIDSIILLTIKLVIITLIFGDKYVEKFQYILVVDEKTTIQDLEAMLVQALLFRLVVILYETICLSGTIIPQTQGMTFGKRLMKLRVVKCEIAESVDRVNNRVRVIPGGVLGFRRSLLRAFLKSCIVSVLFPMLIPLNFVAFHNRLIYDLCSGSIVVQNIQIVR